MSELIENREGGIGGQTKMLDGVEKLRLQVQRQLKAIIAECEKADSAPDCQLFWDYYSRATTDPGKYEGFAQIASLLAAKWENVDYLEIGSNKGQSMALIGLLLKQAGVLGHAVSIDPYFAEGYVEFGLRRPINKTTRRIAEALYQSCDLDVEIIEKASQDGLKQLLIERRKFQLIYVDGSHIWLNPLLDFALSTQLAAPGAFIMLDDMSHRDIRPVYQLVKDNLVTVYQQSRLYCCEWSPIPVFPEKTIATTEYTSED